MSVATPLFNPTLKSVQQAFDDWRATRGKRSRTPVGLQRRAVALRDSHRASHICSALKINNTALKLWAGELSPIPPLLPSPHTKPVGLPTESLPFKLTVSPTHPTHSVSIDLGDAIQLRVHGHFTLEQIFAAARQYQQGSCE